MDQSIDDILNEPTAEATEQTTIVDPPSDIADPPSGRLRDEHGRFTKQETGVAEPAPAVTAAESAPPAEQVDQLPPAEYAALKDERRKRQELERRLDAMQQQLTMKPQQPIPEFWDDPDTHLARRDERLVGSIVQQLQQEQRIERLNLSEAAARDKYADYPEKFAAFEQAVQLNPRLAQEMAMASDPGEFVYSRGKTALEIERHGSIDALLASERQKWEQEAKAAFQPRQQFPATTAADGSVGQRTGPEWAGPTPLSQIIR